MKRYHYTGADREGNPVSGFIDALNERSAQSKLWLKAYIVLEIREQPQESAPILPLPPLPAVSEAAVAELGPPLAGLPPVLGPPPVEPPPMLGPPPERPPQPPGPPPAVPPVVLGPPPADRPEERVGPPESPPSLRRGSPTLRSPKTPGPPPAQGAPRLTGPASRGPETARLEAPRLGGSPSAAPQTARLEGPRVGGSPAAAPETAKLEAPRPRKASRIQILSPVATRSERPGLPDAPYHAPWWQRFPGWNVPARAAYLFFACLAVVGLAMILVSSKPQQKDDESSRSAEYQQVELLVKGRLVMPASAEPSRTHLLLHLPELPLDFQRTVQELEIGPGGEFELELSFESSKAPTRCQATIVGPGVPERQVADVLLEGKPLTGDLGEVVVHR
ncbi:MAG: hypothetical protein HY319_27680 [Armatimonadetes bacterium]|nr:hypothetical protein [Armatimonadota bacterium]